MKKINFQRPTKQFVGYFVSITVILSFLLMAIIFLTKNIGLAYIPLMVFFIPLISLEGYIELAFPKGGQRTVDIILIWLKNMLKLLYEILVLIVNIFLDLTLRAYMMMLIIAFFGIFTLYLFTIPGGLIGLMASYLVELSRSNGTDFQTTYAVFSTAIVMLTLMAISLTKLTFTAFSYEETAIEDNENETAS